MSIRKRILNVARAELKSAAKKAAQLIDGSGDKEDSLLEEELEKMREEEARSRAKAPKSKVKGGGGSGPGEPAHIRKYYANLELPIGASLSEVKASYRRLMRRYHPDLHQGDGEKAKVATRLAQELRVAYDGLVAYLEPREGKGR